MARTHILKGFSDINSALWIHKYHPGLTRNEMVEKCLENGFEVTDTNNYEIAQLLIEWGLASKKEKSLTKKGECFYQLWETKRNVAIDIIHSIQYSKWSKYSPTENLSSWAYKIICDFLWEMKELPQKNNLLLTYVENSKSARNIITPNDIGGAFSTKSINDAYDWLLQLEPPVISGLNKHAKVKSYVDAQFNRRKYCSTELLIESIIYYLRENDYKYDDMLLLDDYSQNEICSFCLIDIVSLEMMIDQTVRTYPGILSIQKEWGMYIGLKKKPNINDYL